MSNRKTHEEFIEEIKIKHPNIMIIGKYVNSTTKILCECKLDGYQWSPSPHSLMSGHGCPKCSKNNKMTHSDFLKKLESINPNIEIIEEYKNANTKLLCKCRVDGNEWYAKPSNLIHLKRGCPICGKEKISNKLSLLQSDFINRLIEYNKKK